MKYLSHISPSMPVSVWCLSRTGRAERKCLWTHRLWGAEAEQHTVFHAIPEVSLDLSQQWVWRTGGRGHFVQDNIHLEIVRLRRISLEIPQKTHTTRLSGRCLCIYRAKQIQMITWYFRPCVILLSSHLSSAFCEYELPSWPTDTQPLPEDAAVCTYTEKHVKELCNRSGQAQE